MLWPAPRSHSDSPRQPLRHLYPSICCASELTARLRLTRARQRGCRRSAFAGTDLADFLRNAGVTQVVLTGIATGAGVASNARSAYDACLDGNQERHEATLAHDVPSYGFVVDSASVIVALQA